MEGFSSRPTTLRVDNMDNQEQRENTKRNAFWENVAVIAVLLVSIGLLCAVLVTIAKEFTTP